MNKLTWGLLLAAACADPLENGRAATLRQPMVPAPPAGTSGQLSNPGGSALDQFGHALVWGRFNADMFPDLAVGAPGTLADRGRVYIYYGTVDGPGPMPAIIDPPSIQLIVRFGTALAVMDADGNGYDDLVVGAPSFGTTNPSAGEVFVILSTPAGLETNLTMPVFTGDTFGFGGLAYFGASLAPVKPDGVWVGAPGAMGKGSAVQLTRSGGGPLVVTALLHGSAPNDEFGAALVSVNIDMQGRPDVVVGRPGAGSGAGAATSFMASSTVGFDGGSMVYGGAAIGRFGAALALVDDANGTIAVGSPALPPGLRGRVSVGRIGMSGQLTETSEGDAGSELGSALAMSDLNGDGKPELYVGAPGGVLVRPFDTTPLRRLPADLGVPNSLGSRFGCALAGGVNSFGDLAQDLAVGAEAYTDPANAFAGGAVFLFAGNLPGVTPGDAGMGDAGVIPPPVDAGPPPDAGTLTIEVLSPPGPKLQARPTGLSLALPYRWDFGDMSPIDAEMSATIVTHDYLLPGGYRVRVVPGDREDLAQSYQVKIPNWRGDSPPSANCTADAKVTAGAVDVSASAETDDASAVVYWDFGDGELDQGLRVSRRYGPFAARRVHCYVHSTNGLWAHDSVMVRVGDGPPCQVAFNRPAGAAPHTVMHSVEMSPNMSVITRLTGEDGGTLEPGRPVVYLDDALGGFHPVTGFARSTSGADCLDRARVFTYTQPVFTSLPPALECDKPFEYAVEGEGGALSLTNETDGVTLEGTKTVHAPASASSQVLGFDLILGNTFAYEKQKVHLETLCGRPRMRLEFDTPPCGCSGSAAGPLGALLLLLLRRRRR